MKIGDVVRVVRDPTHYMRGMRELQHKEGKLGIIVADTKNYADIRACHQNGVEMTSGEQGFFMSRFKKENLEVANGTQA